MNIHDFWDGVIPDPEPSLETVQEALRLRRSTYRGFAELENHYGFLTPETDLAGSAGQEMVRILLLRGVEELLEAQNSSSFSHFREEVIDSLNYFWTLGILDPKKIRERVLAENLLQSILLVRYCPEDETLPSLRRRVREGWGDILEAAHPLLESLRNRAWQHQSQSLYFDGVPALLQFLRRTTRQLLEYFPSWEEFHRYYLAKDRVLQFRLRSRY